MKITLHASTKLGSNKITFWNPKQAEQALKAMDGDLVLEITLASSNPTEKQFWYFRKDLLPKFMKYAADNDHYYNEAQAVEFLLESTIGGWTNDLFIFLSSEQFEEYEGDKKEVGEVIEKIKVFVNNFFLSN